MSKKIEQCPSCQSFQKKFKVLQADYEFEIKKLNEDKSTEKALYEMHTNKQIKKLTDKCQKQRQERIKENQNWMKKYDELVEKHKQQIQHYKLVKDKEIEQYKDQKKNQIQSFKAETVSKLEQSIVELKLSNQTIKIELNTNFQSQIQLLKIAQEQKVHKIIQRYDEQLKKKCAQYEAILTGVQSEKTVEQNLHKKTKEQLKQSQTRLLQDIYCLKRSIIDHQQKIQALKSEIKQKSQNIESLSTEIIDKQNQYNQQYLKLSKQYDEKYQSHKTMMEKKLEQLFKRQLQNCNKYEKALEKIQQHRDIENKMYKANINDIKSCVEERPSRLQDVEEIIKLRQKLLKRQRQCQTLFQELKSYKLELENKEETYNKIFGPDSKNNENIYIRRKDLKLKRAGKSVTTVRQILGAVNNTNYLAPLVGTLDRKLPPKHNKIL